MDEVIDLESRVGGDGKVIWDMPRTRWERAYDWFSFRFEQAAGWVKRTASSLYDLLSSYVKRADPVFSVEAEEPFSQVESRNQLPPLKEQYLLPTKACLLLPAYHPPKQKEMRARMQAPEMTSPSVLPDPIKVPLEERIPSLYNRKPEDKRGLGRVETPIVGDGLASARVLYFMRFCQSGPLYTKASYTRSSASSPYRFQDELVSLYRSSAWTVSKIAEYLNRKYKVSMSSSGISRRARQALGVRSRREARAGKMAA